MENLHFPTKFLFFFVSRAFFKFFRFFEILKALLKNKLFNFPGKKASLKLFRGTLSEGGGGAMGGPGWLQLKNFDLKLECFPKNNFFENQLNLLTNFFFFFFSERAFSQAGGFFF